MQNSPELPIVVNIRLHDRTDAGQIDTEVYCVNITNHVFLVSTQSNSFTTVDEEVGTVVEHGSAPTEVQLASGEAALIGEVAGWEWDGHVGLNLTFQCVDTGSICEASYALKNSSGYYSLHLPGKLSQEGYITPPRFHETK